MMALSGVLSSWLTVPRKLDLARLARSDSAAAAAIASSVWRRSINSPRVSE